MNDETKPLYSETDASRIGLGAALPQAIVGTGSSSDEAPDNNIVKLITVTSLSLSAVERRYSNIEREVLAILHGLEKFYHCCFAREVSIITEHKPLLAIFKKV